MANLSTILKRDTAGRIVTDGIADDAVTIAKVSPALISGATALTTLSESDCILVSDTSASDNRKVTLETLSEYMKTKSTALLAVVTFNCDVGSGDSLPTSMAVAHNPHGLSVAVSSNRIRLEEGIWEIQTALSGYYNSWSGWHGSNKSEQRVAVTLEIDGGAASTIVPSGALTYSGGGSNAPAASFHQPGNGGDATFQVKVASVGYVTPIRRMDNIGGGVGVYSSGRSVAYVYKLA
jgi:hypothetical protein